MMIKQQDQQVFVVEENMSNLTSPVSGEASVSSSSNNNNRGEPSNSIIYPTHQQQHFFTHQQQELSLQDHSELLPPAKKKRNQPGNPDPDSEVVALSPTTLLAKNRFVCEICNKGFQRDQNLQLHRRGHNLPWKLKQRSKTEVIRKKVYVCPETSCVHHDPSRALGDLTGIKKHFCRKHGEKKWKCEKCSKKYAVQSDWKAHSKICGTREYRCDCGTLFSRRDSFITHRAFCDALAEETARAITTTHPLITNTISAVPSNLNFMNMQQQQHQQHQQQQHAVQFHQDQHAPSLKREQHSHHHHQQHQQNQQNFINLPPWLASSPMEPPPTHHHLSSSLSSSIFHHHDQDHHQQHHHQQQQHQQEQQFDGQSQNPRNPSIVLGPTFTTNNTTSYQTQVASSAHMSATALLQQAAQMGARVSQNQGHVTDNNSHNTTTTAPTTTTSTAGLFGLNLSSRDIHHHQDTISSSTITTTCGPGPGPGPSSSSSVFLHDMMVNSLSSSSYDDAFGMGDMGMLSSTNSTNKRNHSTMAFGGGGGGGGRGVEGNGGGGGGGGNEGLTRDFLGLRPLSQNEILTIAELSNCIASHSNTTTNQQENHKQWEN